MLFRVTPLLSRARIFLQCVPSDVPVARFSRAVTACRLQLPPEREPCPPPPDEHPPPKDDRLFWSAMAVLVLAGSFAVYAKQNPEVRDWLTINAPWFDDMIAVAFQENMTYGELAIRCGSDLKNYLLSFMNAPRECSYEGSGPIVGSGASDKDIIALDDEDDEEDETDDKEEVEETACETLPPPEHARDVCELESCLRDAGDTIINNYLTARDACMCYSKFVKECMQNFKITEMKNLKKEMEERKELVRVSLENIAKSQAELNDVHRYLDCGVKVEEEKVNKIRELYQDYLTNINLKRAEFLWENDKALARDELLLKVDCVVDRYTEENKAMYGALDYYSERPQLGDADADFLLLHTFKYIKQLKQEVFEAADSLSERVDRALNVFPEAEKAARDTTVKVNIAKRKLDMEKDLQNLYTELRNDHTKQMDNALKVQLQKQTDQMNDRLVKAEAETTAKADLMVAEKVAQQREDFAMQLKDMASKVAVVEDKLNERLKAERETRRSQALWAAGAALLAATRRAEPLVDVSAELRAIQNNAGVEEGDKLVTTVLQSIPRTVWEKGVVPESVLREKYRSMEKIALKVALVEEDGGPLPLYMLSWIQSALLFMRLSTIPQKEIDNPPEEPAKDLDTFDLLQRARYYMEQNNTAAALRYVGRLSGASRGAALGWSEAARAHCETRQAAEALLAHAAAIGLQYV